MPLRKIDINNRRTFTRLKWSELYDAATEAEIGGNYYLARVLWQQAFLVAGSGINRKYAYAKSAICLKQISDIQRDSLRRRTR